jgi:hypothetical protein
MPLVLMELPGQLPAGKPAVAISAWVGLDFVSVNVVGRPVTVGAVKANAGDETTADAPTTAAPPTPSFFSASRRSMSGTF